MPTKAVSPATTKTRISSSLYDQLDTGRRMHSLPSESDFETRNEAQMPVVLTQNEATVEGHSYNDVFGVLYEYPTRYQDLVRNRGTIRLLQGASD